MPVQINEILIRANITEGKEKEKQQTGTSQPADKEEIIRECVEKVMEIIDYKHSR